MVAIKSKVVGKAEQVLYPCNGKCLATSLAKKIKEKPASEVGNSRGLFGHTLPRARV